MVTDNKRVVSDVKDPYSLPPPMISEDGQLIAGFYQLVQIGPKRVGFAVIDAADQLRPESLLPVPEQDQRMVDRLRDSAKAYLSTGRWREMVIPDWTSFDAGRDSLQWKDLNLTVTVSEEGNLWFSHSNTGKILGVTPFASRLIENRGCSVHMMYHNIVLSNVAGFDPQTGLAFLAFDIVEGGQDSPYFVPFKCNPSALVHIVRVDWVKQPNR